jgi:hypothetical protein
MKLLKLCLMIIVLLNLSTTQAVQLEGNKQQDVNAKNDKLVTNEILEVTGAWARPSLSSNNNSAVYMSIKNNTSEQLTIVGASAATIANNVELHKSFIDEKGISKMAHLDKIVIPANSTIELTPGGIHVMLFDLKKSLNTDDVFDLTLACQNKGVIVIKVTVK